MNMRVHFGSNPQERRRGRPKQFQRRTLAKDQENIGRAWGEAKRFGNNRTQWKAMVEALCLTMGKEN